MPIIALQGIRGGIGTTSVTAALGWALSQLGEKVLVIDFSPENMLRLHYSMPVATQRGWASAELAGGHWQQGAMSYNSHLDFLPFGQVSPTVRAHIADSSTDSLPDIFQPSGWQEPILRLKKSADYQWILCDVPAGESQRTRQVLSLADSVLLLMFADAQCHVRLHQQNLPTQSHFLINQYMPASVLQQDIMALWQQTLTSLVPVQLHRDEAMAESMAGKQPAGQFRPQSKVAQEIMTLANWCLINLRDTPK